MTWTMLMHFSSDHLGSHCKWRNTEMGTSITSSTTTKIARASQDKINWRLVVDNHIIPALEWFVEQGITPTLRTLFYRLVSLQVIPNTKNSYKRLTKVLVKERKEGNIEWDAIADEGRLVVCNFNDVYESPQEYIQRGINHVKNAHSKYKVPRWHNQKHYVEMWIEKQALTDAFESFLEDRQVRIVVNKGYAGWTFLSENAGRLMDIHLKYPDKRIHVLYFGDFDPSGEDMDRHLSEALSYFELQYIVDFERVAVTEEQIDEYELPPVPKGSETLDKLDKDSRKDGFVDKYGQLIAVELDALPAIVPEQFKQLIQESVDQYFDETIYRRERAKYSAEKIRRLVHKKVRFLDDDTKEVSH
jgi:hypothetical protein